MFKQTDKDTQFDMFGSVSGVLVGQSLKEYNNERVGTTSFASR